MHSFLILKKYNFFLREKIRFAIWLLLSYFIDRRFSAKEDDPLLRH